MDDVELFLPHHSFYKEKFHHYKDQQNDFQRSYYLQNHQEQLILYFEHNLGVGGIKNNFFSKRWTRRCGNGKESATSQPGSVLVSEVQHNTILRKNFTMLSFDISLLLYKNETEIEVLKLMSTKGVEPTKNFSGNKKRHSVKSYFKEFFREK